MKTLLALLLLSLSLLADERADAFKERFHSPKGSIDTGGAGECPNVGTDELAPFVYNRIYEKLKDPGSLVIVSWTQPELKALPNHPEYKRWMIYVDVRAKNSYGGYGERRFIVSIRKGIAEVY